MTVLTSSDRKEEAALLSVKELSVAYRGEGIVLDRVTLNVDHREILGIVGESGCGKTTLIRAVFNLLSPGAAITSGEMRFQHADLRRNSREEWRKLRGSAIAMIFQNPGSHFTPILTIGRQFVESIHNHCDLSKAAAREKAVQMLRRVHLLDVDRVMRSYPFQLSGGMKQRVAIAMALAMEPKLLLADEPTSALDVMTQVQIIHELMSLREDFDTSIIMVTHNIGCAAYMADRIVVMNQGKIVECGPKERLVAVPQTTYTQSLLAAIPELREAEA